MCSVIIIAINIQRPCLFSHVNNHRVHKNLTRVPKYGYIYHNVSVKAGAVKS